MEKQVPLKKYLHALDNLICRERTAIIFLEMKRLERIQLEKKTLLILMQQVERTMDQESLELAIKIKNNNKRNELLLQAGLKLIGGLRQNINQRRSHTYSIGGEPVNRGIDSRIVKGRI